MSQGSLSYVEIPPGEVAGISPATLLRRVRSSDGSCQQTVNAESVSDALLGFALQRSDDPNSIVKISPDLSPKAHHGPSVVHYIQM